MLQKLWIHLHDEAQRETRPLRAAEGKHVAGSGGKPGHGSSCSACFSQETASGGHLSFCSQYVTDDAAAGVSNPRCTVDDLDIKQDIMSA